jgi:hypothetical protein
MDDRYPDNKPIGPCGEMVAFVETHPPPAADARLDVWFNWDVSDAMARVVKAAASNAKVRDVVEAWVYLDPGATDGMSCLKIRSADGRTVDCSTPRP